MAQTKKRKQASALTERPKPFVQDAIRRTFLPCRSTRLIFPPPVILRRDPMYKSKPVSVLPSLRENLDQSLSILEMVVDKLRAMTGTTDLRSLDRRHVGKYATHYVISWSLLTTWVAEVRVVISSFSSELEKVVRIWDGLMLILRSEQKSEWSLMEQW